jgi:6-phosphofructokinase 1
VTIGGDDTAFSAMKVAERAGGRIHVAHVPKTIDNDLDLPPGVDTFGYQTARHIGTKVVETLMEDAKTASRWYVVVAMGRSAGHLALGMGKAAGATLTLVTEEFRRPLRLRTLVDTLVGAIIKRQSLGRPDGVAVVAEGVSLALDPADFEEFGNVERDAHGHIRLAEVNLGDVLKEKATARLRALGLKTTIADKEIGYELRCADPIPFDLEYTRELGYSAADFLASGGNAAMVSLRGGEFVPVPFQTMLDSTTGRTRVRLVDVTSTGYRIARHFMIRLSPEDFSTESAVSKLAAVTNLDAAGFRREFEHVIAS